MYDLSLWLLPPGMVLAWAAFVAVRLGLHERLPLALGPMSLITIPDRAARRWRDRALFTTDAPCAWHVPALRGRWPDATSWSAARILATADCLARMFEERLAVQRGDRVAILKQNHLDIHVLGLGVTRAGGIACPINGRFAAAHLDDYLRAIGARLLITDSASVQRLIDEGGSFGDVRTIVIAEAQPSSHAAHAQVMTPLAPRHPRISAVWLEDALTGIGVEPRAAHPRADEPLYLVHSSGTTGAPKPVPLRDRAQSHAVRGWLCYVHISRTVDRGYLAVPNNHQAVILSFHALLLLGVRVHWTAAYDRAGFDAGRVIRELADGRFTGFFGFPIAYTQLKEVALDRHDLRSMRFWASTADASHEAVQRRFVRLGSAFRRLGLPLRGSIYLDAQGSSEVGTPSVIRYITPLTRKFGRRVGRPGSAPFGPRIRIVGADGEQVAVGDVGRLEVRGPSVFDGYWNHPELTELAFRDGWFFTGDVVRRGSDGHIVQLDREVDVIHTRAGPVYTLPIEEKVHMHEAVFDACVYGERQADGTQLPAAAIAVRSGCEVDAAQLHRELNAMLDVAERLARVEIIEWSDFPIGMTGKTLKRSFRDAAVHA